MQFPSICPSQHRLRRILYLIPLSLVSGNVKLSADTSILCLNKKLHPLLCRFEDTQVRLLTRHLRRKVLLAAELATATVPSMLLIDDLPLEDLDVVNHVTELSRQGTTVVCSLRICSLDILEKFERVIVISKQNVIFNGSLKGLWNILMKGSFEHFNFRPAPSSGLVLCPALQSCGISNWGPGQRERFHCNSWL